MTEAVGLICEGKTSRLAQLAKRVNHDGDGDDKGAKVTRALADFHASQPHPLRKEQDAGDEEEPVACCCQQIGTPRFPASLRKHIACHDDSAEWEREELPSERHNTHRNHRRIVAKESDEWCAKQPSQSGDYKQEGRADTRGKPPSALQSAV